MLPSLLHSSALDASSLIDLISCRKAPLLCVSAQQNHHPKIPTTNVKQIRWKQALLNQKNKVMSNHHSDEVVPQIQRVFPVSDFSVQHLIAHNSGTSFVETACNVVESLIAALLGPQSLTPSIDPNVQLSGNCAPVPETPPHICTEVQGILPSDLNGIYIRNGPNAARLFEHEGYHMFDGDGMLHGIRIRSGTASYCSRYVRTSRFVQEELAGRPLFLKFFGGFFGPIGFARGAIVLVRAILGVLSMNDGWGLSNTSVCYFNGKILSLSEDDMPYVIKVTSDGDLITEGRLQFPEKSIKRNMCAHPKFDPATGDMFAFSFRPSCTPFSFFRVSADGVKSPDVQLPLRDISLIHDFAITTRYAIFPDNQFVLRPLKLLRGEMIVVCDRKKTPRFCLLPLSETTNQVASASHALWFDVPGCNSFHYINAWDEGDEVVVITPIISPPDRFLEIPTKNIRCTLTEVRLNIKTGSSSLRKICSGNVEFGTFNHSYQGRKIRYAYLATGCYPELDGVVKVDLQASSESMNGFTNDYAIVGRRCFGENCHGNEPFFVPRGTHDGGDEATAEDFGYVLCLVHEESTGVSKLLVMDAQSPSLELVASVKLPSRVPYGFHGWFVNEDQLTNQNTV